MTFGDLVKDVQLLRCEPGDVLLLRLNGPARPEHLERLRKTWEHAARGTSAEGVRVLVLPEEVTLEVLRAGDEIPPGAVP